MLVEAQHEEMEMIGGGETVAYTIQADAKMFDMLSSKVYSNKILAPLRELSCNAWDAHLAVGKKDPIEVHLPTYLDPWLAITDHGPGLSHEDVMHMYTTYGKSLKNQDNRFIGGFGIGSKSPFAYTDSFTVTSRFNGVKSIYTMYRDSERMPQVTLVDQAATDEGNGLTVQLPVLSGDIYKFEREASEFFRYWEVLPVFNMSLTIEQVWEHYNKVDTAYGQAWVAPRKYAAKSHIIMGGVAYAWIGTHIKSDLLKTFNNLTVDLRVPIGAVDVAIDREKLEYTAKTINYLNTAFEEIVRASRAGFVQALETETHFPKWRALFIRTVSKQPWLWEPKPSFTFQGTVYIENEVFDALKLPDTVSYFTRYWTKGRSGRVNYQPTFKVGDYSWTFKDGVLYGYIESAMPNPDKTLILWNDLTTGSLSLQRRLERICMDQPEIDQLIYVKSEADAQQVLDYYGLPGWEVLPLSTFAPVALPPRALTKGQTRKEYSLYQVVYDGVGWGEIEIFLAKSVAASLSGVVCEPAKRLKHFRKYEDEGRVKLLVQAGESLYVLRGDLKRHKDKFPKLETILDAKDRLVASFTEEEKKGAEARVLGAHSNSALPAVRDFLQPLKALITDSRYAIFKAMGVNHPYVLEGEIEKILENYPLLQAFHLPEEVRDEYIRLRDLEMSINPKENV